ncbi:prepilin peptidase [bacterium CPR1]|nr:prepilin peptidase [bacterium CPR1]
MYEEPLPFELLATPNPFSLVVVFLFGSLVGSFLNVVIYRTPLERSIVLPGSACTTCGTPLKWWHNIPILSYFLLGGRCAYCSSSYSSRYMLIEVFVGASATALFWFYAGPSLGFFATFALFGFCLAVFFTDLDHWIIPDQVNFSGMLVGLLFAPFLMPRMDFDLDPSLVPAWLLTVLSTPWSSNLLSALLGIGVGMLFFTAIQVVGTILARQEAMGGGDVKFAGLIGAFLGWRLALLAFLLSFFLGALIAIPLMLWRRGRGKDPIPFGTFMAVAAVVVALHGERLFDFLVYWPEYFYPTGY